MAAERPGTATPHTRSPVRRSVASHRQPLQDHTVVHANNAYNLRWLRNAGAPIPPVSLLAADGLQVPTEGRRRLSLHYTDATKSVVRACGTVPQLSLFTHCAPGNAPRRVHSTSTFAIYRCCLRLGVG